MTGLDDIYDYDWVREPPEDYNLDDEPSMDLLDLADAPMLVIINGELHGWNDDINNFERLPYDLEDGKVVARSDGS